MKPLQWKEFFRCVLKTKSRFISMLLITALGVAFYVGIKASGPDMELSADAYYDRTNLMDIRVLGTLGMTEDDVEAIRSIEGVTAAQGGYSVDALCPVGSTEYVATVFSLCDEINQMTVEQGRLPEAPDECFMDSWFMNNTGLQIGDTISLLSGTDDPLSDSLALDSFTIVGSGSWSWYLSWERGTTGIGSGNINFFLGLLPEAFSMEAYTAVYATVDSADSLNSYSEEYDNLIQSVTDRIEAIALARCEIRYDSVTADAREELDKAQQEIDDAQKELDDAWAELEDARLKIEEAEAELKDGEQELITGRLDLVDAETEIKDGVRELGDGRKALIEGKAELATQTALFNQSKSELEAGQRELNEQRAALQSTKAEILAQKAELEKKQIELTEQKAQLEQQKTELEATKSSLLPQKEDLEAKKKEVEGPLNELKAQRAELVSQRDSIDQAIALFDQRDALVTQRAELAEQLDQVELSLTALKAARAIYDSQMPDLIEQEASLQTELAHLDVQQAALSQQQTELDARSASVQSARDAVSALSPGQWTTVSGYNSMLSLLSSQGDDLAGRTVRQILCDVRDSVNSSLPEEGELTDDYLASVVPDAAADAIASANRQLDREAASVASDQTALNIQQSSLSANRMLLESSIQALSEVLTPLKDAVTMLDEKENELNGYQEALTDGIAQIDDGLSQINAALDSIGMTRDELVEAKKALEDGIAQIDANLPTLESALAQINDGLSQINSGIAQIDDGLSQINSYLTQIADGQKQIEGGLIQMEDGLIQMEEGEDQIRSAQNTIDEGRRQLESGEQELLEARQLLYEKQKELDEGIQALTDARRQLSDGHTQLADGAQTLADGRRELDDGRKEYEDGLKKYNDALAEAEPELADARAKLADARAQLDEIGTPEWYVLDRNSIQTFVEYGMDADRIRAVGEVFPVLFFLVAALVCLTGMTRMVEEERIQIGTFKALGYSNGMIAAKYFLYAFIASLAGSIIGILTGSSVLPYVIMNAYGMLYATLTDLMSPLHWPLSLSAIFIAVACIVSAAMAACLKTLRETPANLMRPTAPPKGKRVFLEYIRPLWRHMSFGQKAAARNLFRYKKRLFMTIFGIAGCTALLLVGFGIQDSIQKIVDTQYAAVWTYDSSLTADADSLSAIRDHILQEETSVLDTLAIRQSAMEARTDERTIEIYLFVPESTENLEEFVRFNDRVSGERYELNDSGVIITEKLASLLNLKAGDSITLCPSETERYTATILAVAENYLYHYVYMTPAHYSALFNEAPEFSQLFFRTEEMSPVDELAFSERLLSIDEVKSVSLVSSLQASVSDMMNAMNLVIWVLIIAAGLLAFIVLFNLNSISILERRRELATLRVLGFYDGELAAYLYRENVVLTLMGIAAGILLGVPLHAYTIGTLELDMIMFGRVIQPLSYAGSVMMTIIFAGIVNFGMFFTLRKIDMVESLKSVE